MDEARSCISKRCDRFGSRARSRHATHWSTRKRNARSRLRDPDPLSRPARRDRDFHWLRGAVLASPGVSCSGDTRRTTGDAETCGGHAGTPECGWVRQSCAWRGRLAVALDLGRLDSRIDIEGRARGRRGGNPPTPRVNRNPPRGRCGSVWLRSRCSDLSEQLLHQQHSNQHRLDLGPDANLPGIATASLRPTKFHFQFDR
jgi:hypothetical protein